MLNDKMRKVVNALGDDTLIICAEECAELIQAITKYKRYVTDPDGKVCRHRHDEETIEYYTNLHEEVGDVLLMIEWLIEYMGLDRKMIAIMQSLKEERAWNRLENGKLR